MTARRGDSQGRSFFGAAAGIVVEGLLGQTVAVIVPAG